MTLELHIPCRDDSIELLMSMANHKRLKQFNCSKFTKFTNTNNNTNTNTNNNTVDKDELIIAANKAWMKLKNTDDRFNCQLLSIPNIDIKCFNPFPLEKYVKTSFSNSCIHKSHNKF
jgi:hypothetical protein